MYEIRYIYSKAIARKVFVESILRNKLLHLVGYSIMVFGMIYLSYQDPYLQSLLWFVLGTSFMVVASMILGLLQSSKYANDNISIVVKLTEEGITTSSSLHSMTMSWRAFTKVFFTSNFIFLISNLRPPLWFPIEPQASELRSFIVSKVPNK